MCLGTVTSGPSIGGRWERWMCKRTAATNPPKTKPNKITVKQAKKIVLGYLDHHHPESDWGLSCMCPAWAHSEMKHAQDAQALMSHSEAVKTFHKICLHAKRKLTRIMTRMNYALIRKSRSLNSRAMLTDFQKESQKDWAGPHTKQRAPYINCGQQDPEAWSSNIYKCQHPIKDALYAKKQELCSVSR